MVHTCSYLDFYGANRKRYLAGYRLNRDPRPLIPNSDPISSSFVITSIKSNERQLAYCTSWQTSS